MRKTYAILVIFNLLYSVTDAQYLTYTRYELLRQGGLQADAKGLDSQYDDIKGNPWYSTRWLPARISTTQGKLDDNMRLKYDTYTNKIYALINDTVYDLSATSVKRFQLYPNFPDTITRTVFQKGFVSADIKSEQFLQVLTEGNVSFLKLQILQIKEVHEDALTTTKKFISQDYFYIVQKNGQGDGIKLNRATLEQQTRDKWTAVSAFLKAKDLSASTEEGWSAGIAYYNTLP